MGRLGIVNNLQAGRVRARLGQVRALLRDCRGEVREVAELASIRAATRELLDAGVEVLAVIGGDGTAQGAITELLRSGAAVPELAILPGGTTNLTAHDLNGRLGLPRAIGALRAQLSRPPAERARVSRPLLEVCIPGAPAEYGFFLGAGAILTGMRHFRERVGARGLRDELAAVLSLLRGLAGIAGGEHAWSHHHTVVTTAEAPVFRGEQNLVLATTLERLLLGMRPWWGREAAPIHLTALAHRPARLLRTLPSILRGRSSIRATPQNGYRSANVRAITLEAPQGFALDGQLFQPPADAGIQLRATPPMTFLRLGG